MPKYLSWSVLAILEMIQLGKRRYLKVLRNKKGFTLIEIIVLIVMAGILLPVIVIPFVTAVKNSRQPEMAATAIYLAHQKMEDFMKFNYGNLNVAEKV